MKAQVSDVEFPSFVIRNISNKSTGTYLQVWGAKSVSPEVKDMPKVAAATLRTESRANLKEVKDDPKVTRPQVNLREEKPFICAACKKQFLSKGSQTM